MRRTSILLIALCFALASCAPSSTPRVEVAEGVESVSFYPHQAGIARAYLPEDEELTAKTLTLRELGPQSHLGNLLYATREYGRGKDTVSYRSYDASGVFLHEEERSNHTLSYDPPLREYPHWQELAPGKQWDGSTTATLSFPDRGITEEIEIRYQYTVLETRSVTINGANVEVFVIDLEAWNDDGSYLSQQHWFAPYIGIVRTTDGKYLIDANIPLRTKG